MNEAVEQEIIKLKELVESKNYEDKKLYDQYKQMPHKFSYTFKDPINYKGCKVDYINKDRADLKDLLEPLQVIKEAGLDENEYLLKLTLVKNKVRAFKLWTLNHIIRWYGSLEITRKIIIDLEDKIRMDKESGVSEEYIRILEKRVMEKYGQIESYNETLEAAYEYYIKISSILDKLEEI